jgi:hypothetical protein
VNPCLRLIKTHSGINPKASFDQSKSCFSGARLSRLASGGEEKLYDSLPISATPPSKIFSKETQGRKLQEKTQNNSVSGSKGKLYRP